MRDPGNEVALNLQIETKLVNSTVDDKRKHQLR